MSRRLSDLAFDFAITQRQDYDTVVRWGNATNRMFTPVQLKEWVPNEVNPDASLANLIDKLEKYVDSPDLNVCFYLKRRENRLTCIHAATCAARRTVRYCIRYAGWPLLVFDR